MFDQDCRWVALVSAISLLVYYLALLNAGLARVRYKVPAPSHEGPEPYLRCVRAHLNTLEHLVLFLPSMWLFALLVSAHWAAIVGAIWPVGRLAYIIAYTKSASARRIPIYITMPSIYLFILGSIIGAIFHLLDGN